MLISYNWLKEYVDISLPPAKLAELLTMSGLSVDYVKEVPGDTIINIEITSNRPDWLSYIGVAREIAAITGEKLRVQSTVHSPQSSVKKRTTNDERRTTIRVEEKALCPKYTGRVITGVAIGESPAWLKTRLGAMGLKPVNNVVDITNFCLFETGEPMHAFDLDKIEGAVAVRRAKKGEKIATIDGLERELDETMLVISDEAKAVAVAGVMGALNTEVTTSTNNIFLEAAYFDPVSVRRTARKLGIMTESSYRFERGVDIKNIVSSSERAAGLISELAGGRAEAFRDIGSAAGKKKRLVSLRLSALNAVLGAEIPSKKVESILKALGLKKSGAAMGCIRFEVPGFRNDLKAEIDLIEEVARVNGYDKIPVTLPAIFDQPERLPLEVSVERKIRSAMSAMGAGEALTYSLLGKKALGSYEPTDVVLIKNPLTSEQEAMRPSLLSGMLGAVSYNINRKAKDLKLFELGNIYRPAGEKFSETMSLSAAITGDTEHFWSERSRHYTFYDIKGMLESLFTRLGLARPEIREAPDARFSKSASASVSLGGRAIGAIGEVSPAALDRFDIKAKVFYFEIDIGAIAGQAGSVKLFEELPRYPSVERDISIVAPKDASSAGIESAIRAAAGPILKELILVDRYRGEQIPSDKTGLTYRLEYRDSSKTLEEQEVAAAHSGVIEALKAGFGAVLR